MENILPPTKSNPEIEKKKLDIAMLKLFMSTDRQKTQITPDERILISVLDVMSDDPYPISREICEKNKIPFSQQNFKLDFLKEFLNDFIEYGIPVGRQGRNEEVKVLTSYFEAQRQEQKDENKDTVKSKLMK